MAVAPPSTVRLYRGWLKPHSTSPGRYCHSWRTSTPTGVGRRPTGQQDLVPHHQAQGQLHPSGHKTFELLSSPLSLCPTAITYWSLPAYLFTPLLPVYTSVYIYLFLPFIPAFYHFCTPASIVLYLYIFLFLFYFIF